MARKLAGLRPGSRIVAEDAKNIAAAVFRKAMRAEKDALVRELVPRVAAAIVLERAHNRWWRRLRRWVGRQYRRAVPAPTTVREFLEVGDASLGGGRGRR